MSTRCNVIIKDEHNELIFYRHSDGYPKSIIPSLERFLGFVKDGTIRDNVGQAAGWLILLGAVEYQTMLSSWFSEGGKLYSDKIRERIEHTLKLMKPMNWECGAYEPTTSIHGDIAYLYIVDLDTKTIHIDSEDGYKYTGVFSVK